jgi:hypothetical protein
MHTVDSWGKKACKTWSSHVGTGLILWAAGCGSYTLHQTAEPLAKGTWRITAGAHAGRLRDVPSDLNTSGLGAEVSVRVGVGGSTDMEAKVYTAGLEFGVKHKWIESGRWRFATSVALGGVKSSTKAGLTDSLTLQGRLAALGTYRLSSQWAFSAGPVLSSSAFIPAGAGSSTGSSMGAFVNAQWSWGPTLAWHVIPEVTAHKTLAGDVPVRGALVFAGLAIARDF